MKQGKLKNDTIMDAKLVERAYNRRFWMLATMSVFLVGFIGSGIAEPFFVGTHAAKILTGAGHLCLALMLISLLILDTGRRDMRKNRELHAILNDELDRHYLSKALKWGFAVAILTSTGMGTLSSLLDWSLPMKSACFIIALATYLAVAIPRLIYMKR
jgi:hypothetical protein